MDSVFKDDRERGNYDENMRNISRKLLVMSGKGGVGKSSVAANLAYYFALQTRRTGIVDVDFHGPSLPKMLNIENRQVHADKDKRVHPVKVNEYLHAISMGLMLQSQDDAVIWRGPLKLSAIKQFLSDVKWGERDYLIIDSPPGTGDEPLTVGQFLGEDTDVVIVTTPQDVAVNDVRKSISFCRKLNMNPIGIVVNMSHFVCPECGTRTDIFARGGVEKMAADFDLPILGEIPFEPEVSRAGDNGEFFFHAYGKTPAGKAFESVGERIIETLEKK